MPINQRLLSFSVHRYIETADDLRKWSSDGGTDRVLGERGRGGS